MAKVNLNTIKNWFKTGLKPTQGQFFSVWDSFWHKDDSIPADSIENFDNYLAEKADLEALNNHIDSDISHSDLFEKKVDKADGKELSTNDYTDADKQKVDALPYVEPTYSIEVADNQLKLNKDNQQISSQNWITEDFDIALTPQGRYLTKFISIGTFHYNNTRYFSLDILSPRFGFTNFSLRIGTGLSNKTGTIDFFMANQDRNVFYNLEVVNPISGVVVKVYSKDDDDILKKIIIDLGAFDSASGSIVSIENVSLLAYQNYTIGKSEFDNSLNFQTLSNDNTPTGFTLRGTF